MCLVKTLVLHHLQILHPHHRHRLEMKKKAVEMENMSVAVKVDGNIDTITREE